MTGSSSEIPRNTGAHKTMSAVRTREKSAGEPCCRACCSENGTQARRNI
jgi:hypothetical protein